MHTLARPLHITPRTPRRVGRVDRLVARHTRPAWLFLCKAKRRPILARPGGLASGGRQTPPPYPRRDRAQGCPSSPGRKVGIFGRRQNVCCPLWRFGSAISSFFIVRRAPLRRRRSTWGRTSRAGKRLGRGKGGHENEKEDRGAFRIFAPRIEMWVWWWWYPGGTLLVI